MQGDTGQITAIPPQPNPHLNDAEELARRAAGIYWYLREQLDELLQYLDLRPLPDLDNDGYLRFGMALDEYTPRTE